MAMDNDSKHQDVVTGGGSTERAPPPIKTKAQALGYLNDAITLLNSKREACNVIIPDNVVATERQQKRAERVYLMHIGRVLEAASLLCSVGLIDVVAFETFHKNALNTMAPSVVGVVSAIDFNRRRR